MRRRVVVLLPLGPFPFRREQFARDCTVNPNDMTNDQLAQAVGWKLLNRPLNTKEAAELRGLRPNTLEIERSFGKGLHYMQDDKHSRVTYSERDVLLWKYASRRRHTAQPHPQLAAA